MDKNKKIRQDINLSKYQVFLPSKSKEESKIIQTKTGVIKILSIAEYGALQVFDYKVLLVLTQIWEEKGRDEKTLFSIYEINRTLGMEICGRSYETIKASLIRLSSAPIIWQKSYHDKESGKLCEHLKKYTILDDLDIKTKDDKNETYTIP